MLTPDFTEMMRRMIDGEIELTQRDLGEGHAQDMEAYKNRIGYIEGLKKSKEYMEKVIEIGNE